MVMAAEQDLGLDSNLVDQAPVAHEKPEEVVATPTRSPLTDSQEPKERRNIVIEQAATRTSVRRPVVVLVMAVVVALMAGPAAAQGPDPDRLDDAGWFCFGHTTAAIHCLPDGDAVFSGEATSSVILTWDADTREFWGTELLLHEDTYNQQPCPQDEVNGEPTTYLHLSDLGLDLPYFVCHHFESPLT